LIRRERLPGFPAFRNAGENAGKNAGANPRALAANPDMAKTELTPNPGNSVSTVERRAERRRIF
jgi:hypothetical protein